MKVLLAITIWFTINIFVRIHYLWYVSIWKGGDFILQSYPHWGNWIYRYVSFFAKPPDCSTFSPLNVPDLKPIFHLGNAMAISQEKKQGSSSKKPQTSLPQTTKKTGYLPSNVTWLWPITIFRVDNSSVKKVSIKLDNNRFSSGA